MSTEESGMMEHRGSKKGIQEDDVTEEEEGGKGGDAYS
jgi:hypothetical protein